MEHYLSQAILHEIYSYMSWNDLRHHKSVPDRLWRRWFDHFNQDDNFKTFAHSYWGQMMIKIATYKILLLNFLDYLVAYGEWSIPHILLEDKNFVIQKIRLKDNLPYYYRIDDTEILLERITVSPWVLRNHETYRKNRDFIIRAVQCNGFALIYADDFRYDVDIVSMACKQVGINQGGYKELILAAVNKGLSINLENLDDDLRAAVNILKAQIHCRYDKYRFVNFARLNREEALQAVKHYGDNFHLIHPTHQSDLEIALEALKDGCKIHRNLLIAYKLNTDRHFCMQCVSCFGFTLSYLGDKFTQDKEIVLAAVRNDPAVIQYAHPALLRDRDFTVELLRCDRRLFSCVDDELKCDPDFVRVALQFMCKI